MKSDILTYEYLYDQYIVQNKDTKTIADEVGLHFNTVRSKLKSYNIKKDSKNISISMRMRYMKKTGFFHPSQNSGLIANRLRFQYNPMKSDSILFFGNINELYFALFLDNNDEVESWDYRLIKIPYMDTIKKLMRMYYIDFSIQSASGDKWVELKLHNRMVPHMKRLYASYAARRANIKFCGISKSDLEVGHKLFRDGFRRGNIEFINPS